ncbi:MAG: glycosyltransferase [Gammaproteobacteria bacterium]|nr:glycosyltransferase [Gammaproteobacteria bacterium]
MNRPRPDLAVLASFSGEGGVERMLLNLVNAFAARGLKIHLVLIRTRSRHLDEIDPTVQVIELGSRHTVTSLLPLIRYLRTTRPARMLVAKDRAGRLAVLARLLAGIETRIVVRLGTNLTAALAHRSQLKRWLRGLPIRLLYPQIDQIIAVSTGVKQDILAVSGIDSERVSVVRNPVLTPRLPELAHQAPPHPWLSDPQIPVILGAGRLTIQKDFATLMRAFAKLRETHVCRLIILGDGRQKESLQQLATELGVLKDMALPGFSNNPYAYMARCSLFVLSSRWEGSPNVLTEAMALGRPVVATDCPSGPAEILQGGRVAPLVPVGDWRALASAMARILDTPPDGGSLRQAVSEYTVDTSAHNYLRILDLESI